ncbi:MAG: HK97-gp10 family putative phage morphogenesis protein [Alphaproteobacteria bacterium]
MIKISVTGEDRLARRLAKLERDIRSGVAKALREGAEVIAESARERVADQTDGTGDLEESIRVVTAPDGLSARVEATAPHAAHVEFGTVDQPAQPFMTPAVEENRQAVVDGVRDAVRNAIKR